MEGCCRGPRSARKESKSKSSRPSNDGSRIERNNEKPRRRLDSLIHISTTDLANTVWESGPIGSLDQCDPERNQQQLSNSEREHFLERGEISPRRKAEGRDRGLTVSVTKHVFRPALELSPLTFGLESLGKCRSCTKANIMIRFVGPSMINGISMRLLPTTASRSFHVKVSLNREDQCRIIDHPKYLHYFEQHLHPEPWTLDTFG